MAFPALYGVTVVGAYGGFRTPREIALPSGTGQKPADALKRELPLIVGLARHVRCQEPPLTVGDCCGARRRRMVGPMPQRPAQCAFCLIGASKNWKLLREVICRPILGGLHHQYGRM